MKRMGLKDGLLATFLLFILLLSSTSGFPVKVFSMGHLDDTSTSYVGGREQITDGKNLSSNDFIFCGSFKIYSLSLNFFTIYGDDYKDWMSLSLWDTSREKEKKLWISIRSSWETVTVLHWSKIFFWMHICLHVDVKENLVKVRIDDQQIIKIPSNKLKEHIPNNPLKSLVLGKDNSTKTSITKKWVGSISNIAFFEKSEVAALHDMKTDLCKEARKRWSESLWNLNGNVQVDVTDSSMICNLDGTYKVALFAAIPWLSALALCPKLGEGSMLEIRNETDLDIFVDMFDDKCLYIWQPFTDEKEEGVYKNIYTGERATFLPWYGTNPNGKEEENCLAVEYASKAYYDLPASYESCLACRIDKSVELKFTGPCESSYFGKLLMTAGTQ